MSILVHATTISITTSSMFLTMEQIKFLFILFLLSNIATSFSYLEDHQTYIIHMDKSLMPSVFPTHHDWYMSTLSTLLTPQGGIPPTHLYTYNHVMNGFSAALSQSQLKQLEQMPGHVASIPEAFGQLHTTHTPRFLGLKKHAGLWPAGGFGDDMIIGIIDTGIWPERESFNDQGMPPIPSRWRGRCETGTDFNSSLCNRKLIGARSFSKGLKQQSLNISTTYDYDSPRDFLGHGTHTSSTAAGNRVAKVDAFGYAKGTASGIAPRARLAMYKSIFESDPIGSAATDTLAAIDQAIEDGVDLISLSLGFPDNGFYDNPIAVGSFAAMEKGIFVSCSAGNSGPQGYTIFNGAPWITTIGAGTIDRDYLAYVKLGDGNITIKGRSIYPEDLYVSQVEMYYGYGNNSKQNCENYALDPNDVSGKFVFCAFNDEANIYRQLEEIIRIGAAGAVLATDSAKFLSPEEFFLPFVAISPRDGKIVENYFKLSASVPAKVSIKFQITELGSKPAPQVAYFSSRGPTRKAPWVLKPDILAPGVDILAAWVPNRGQVPIRDDYLLTDYTLLSGTSMASPHAVGIAALLKSAHPDWSSAVIRSAMMTTASVRDNANGGIIDMIRGTAGTPLDFGAGHVNPNKALDPGLVYDIDKVEDYINFLCGLNYTSQQISIITKRTNYPCDQANLDLNYPSFIVVLNNTNTTTYQFKRVLTNVVDSPSVYCATIWAPSGMKIVVEPMKLTFGGKCSKAEYKMTVVVDVGGIKPESDSIGNYGYISWYEVNGTHVVRSPIVSAFAPGNG